ncbi:MAG: membrane or secreted protein [Gemmatimonadaceae bacterium]|nr:membrane or secreted protein [Chitinophagaceae bacterium]
MKYFFVLMLALGAAGIYSFRPGIVANDIVGAWGLKFEEKQSVLIATDRGVFSVARYDVAGKKFLGSYGGTYKTEGNKIKQMIEWHSLDSLKVGTVIEEEFTISNGKLGMKKTGSWDRLDDGKPGDLQGAWIITGTYKNDSVSKRANPFHPRRTMKLLSGKYFHWIAYNVATKQFLNAGGGTYTTVKGKYTENIEFFTKTAESVGKTLAFDYSFVDGDWRHRGQKSTGGEMDECWTRRQNFE